MDRYNECIKYYTHKQPTTWVLKNVHISLMKSMQFLNLNLLSVVALRWKLKFIALLRGYGFFINKVNENTLGSLKNHCSPTLLRVQLVWYVCVVFKLTPIKNHFGSRCSCATVLFGTFSVHAYMMHPKLKCPWVISVLCMQHNCTVVLFTPIICYLYVWEDWLWARRGRGRGREGGREGGREHYMWVCVHEGGWQCRFCLSVPS